MRAFLFRNTLKLVAAVTPRRQGHVADLSPLQYTARFTPGRSGLKKTEALVGSRPPVIKGSTLPGPLAPS